MPNLKQSELQDCFHESEVSGDLREWFVRCEPPIVPALVADIFCGSGTVGVVCRKSGRNFVGIELSPEYAEMARQRIANPEPEPEVPEVEGQEMLFDGVPP